MAKLKLLSSDELDLGIRLDPAKNMLADGLDSISTVTSYSHGLINTVIRPVTEPPETWYLNLNRDLGVGREHAQTWLSDIAPEVGSIIPQSIINYGTNFRVTVDAILKILAAGEPSTKDKNKIIALVEDVLETLESDQDDIVEVKTKIITLGKDFQADHERLVTGVGGAADAVKLAQEDQLRMENKINELQTRLEAARAKVTASGIGLGVAIFVTIAAVALAVASGGAAAPLVVAAIGVIGVGAAATTTGIFTAEISGLIEEIAAQQRALDDKKKQVAALNSLKGTVGSLVKQNEAAKQAVGNVQEMWNDLKLKLDAVVRQLKSGKVKPTEVKFKAAQESWNDLATFARAIQDMAAHTRLADDKALYHPNLRALYAA